MHMFHVDSSNEDSSIIIIALDLKISYPIDYLVFHHGL